MDEFREDSNKFNKILNKVQNKNQKNKKKFTGFNKTLNPSGINSV